MNDRACLQTWDISFKGVYSSAVYFFKSHLKFNFVCILTLFIFKIRYVSSILIFLGIVQENNKLRSTYTGFFDNFILIKLIEKCDTLTKLFYHGILYMGFSMANLAQSQYLLCRYLKIIHIDLVESVKASHHKKKLYLALKLTLIILMNINAKITFKCKIKFLLSERST